VPWAYAALVAYVLSVVVAPAIAAIVGHDIQLSASGNLTNTSQLAGWFGNPLVDRFRVVVFPVITGNSGRERIYDGYPDVALDMISSRAFDGRIQLLEYVPTVLAGPPGTNRVNA
jgi:hypothetical protein